MRTSLLLGLLLFAQIAVKSEGATPTASTYNCVAFYGGYGGVDQLIWHTKFSATIPTVDMKVPPEAHSFEVPGGDKYIAQVYGDTKHVVLMITNQTKDVTSIADFQPGSKSLSLTSAQSSDVDAPVFHSSCILATP